MKLRCVRPLRKPQDSAPPGSGLTPGREYVVVEMQFRGDRVTVRVLDDDDRPTLWLLDGFEIVDGAVPANWNAKFDEDGTVTLSAKQLQTDGFWWSYFENEGRARETFDQLYSAHRTRP